MTFVTFAEANPNFSAYLVMGGTNYEGEMAQSTKLFDSKQRAEEYVETLLKEHGFDYAFVSIISNDGTLWKMPGATKTYSIEDGEIVNQEENLWFDSQVAV
jgi:ABC-type thiamine transport system substrate-binding protein